MLVLILRKKQSGQGCVCFQCCNVLSEESLQLKHFRKCSCQSPGKVEKSPKKDHDYIQPNTINSAVKSSATKHLAILPYMRLDYNQG